LKKFIVSILLSVFLFNFAGFAAMFFVEQHIIYFEMNEKLKHEKNLETIVLSKADAQKYSWDDGKELKIDNRMYDIARQEDKGDEIIFYVIHDEAEGNLFAKLESFFDFKNKANSTDGKIELQLVKFLTLVTLTPADQTANKTEVFLTSLSDITPQFTSINISPDKQPPRLS
jgi:hypothetical protein